MIRRIGGNLALRAEPAPEASGQLEQEGYVVLKSVLAPADVEALAAEITEVFEADAPDRPNDEHGQLRHAMLNRSPLSQQAIAAPTILMTIEPLLGEDCHVIANTAWRNIAGHQGGPWHMDAGPHIPRPEGVPWPDAIPYPVFAIGVHIFLQDCPVEAGPTAVIPGSHCAGRLPPREKMFDPDLEYEGRRAVLLEAKAGDAALFVSDAWHRGTPAEEGFGRFFLQAHYARRDIAQRLLTTAEMAQASAEAASRAETERERRLIGLHPPHFYDG